MSSSEGRHRMDRSLDEIAAEMNSGNDSGHVPFGEEYEDRGYVGKPIRGSFSSSKRHTPYSSDRSSSRREKSGCRIFVANLSFSTTQQSFREHMRKAGPVVKCDIFRDASGNSRGMGGRLHADGLLFKKCAEQEGSVVMAAQIAVVDIDAEGLVFGNACERCS